jgi:hypothetical protein
LFETFGRPPKAAQEARRREVKPTSQPAIRGTRLFRALAARKMVRQRWQWPLSLQLSPGGLPAAKRRGRVQIMRAPSAPWLRPPAQATRRRLVGLHPDPRVGRGRLRAKGENNGENGDRPGGLAWIPNGWPRFKFAAGTEAKAAWPAMSILRHGLPSQTSPAFGLFGFLSLAARLAGAFPQGNLDGSFRRQF